MIKKFILVVFTISNFGLNAYCNDENLEIANEEQLEYESFIKNLISEENKQFMQYISWNNVKSTIAKIGINPVLMALSAFLINPLPIHCYAENQSNIESNSYLMLFFAVTIFTTSLIGACSVLCCNDNKCNCFKT